MTNKQIEQQTSHLPNEITTREAFFQKLGTHKISDLTRKTDQGTHREMSLPVDDIYYSPERDTFTIKKELFDQINNEQKAKETQSLIDGTKSEVERTQQETAATAAAKQKTRELDAETRSKAELDKPLRNTYQGYLISLEELAKDFEGIRQTSDKAKRVSKTGKQTLKHVEATAKARKKHVDNVISNVKQQQTKMQLADDAPVGAIHEENFLEVFGEMLALKNDLEHGEHGELSKEARKPNDSKREIKRNTKELKKHHKRQEELNQLLANQEIIKIADDDANLTNQLLREMIDGKMDLAHQMYYQMLFYQLGQYTANYPFIYNSIIERAKADKAFAQSIGYALPTSEYAGGATFAASGSYERRGNGVDVSKLDRGETFTQQGARGVIRKVFDLFPNLTEAQKDTRTTLGFTALLGAGIWQAGKWLFKGKGGFLTKTAIVAGAFLGTQVLFGEDLPSLIKKIATGGISFKELGDRALHSFSLQGKEVQQYAQDNMLMTCFGAYTPATITEQMKERKQGRNLQSRTVFLQELKKSDSENASALEAKFGNPVQVQELEKWLTSIGVGFPAKNALLNEKMSDIQKYQEKNYQILQDWLDKNGKKPKEGSYEKMNNILTKKDPLTLADIEQMDKMQLFETDKERLSPAEQQELTAMNEQIRALNLTPEQKTNLLAVAEGFYKIPETGARPKFGFKNSLTLGEVLLTHGEQEIAININQFSLPHFNTEKPFSNHIDCLSTAYMAAYILEQKKNTPSSNPAPFSYAIQRKGIVFDDADVASRDFDTRVLSTGWFGASKEVSQEVGDHPERFADYLNELWQHQSENRTSANFEALPDTAQTKDQINQFGLSPNDAYLAQKACNEIYATYGAEAKQLGIHFRKEGEHLIFTSYGKEMKINLTTKSLEGLTTTKNEAIPFTNIAELIKAANFINVIKYHSQHMTALANKQGNGTVKYDIHPFYVDTYGNLMFRGTGENTTVATGMHRILSRLPGGNNAIQANSPTLNTHKDDIVRYLNKHNPPFRQGYDK